ncbi:hypothetical protein FA13DRAFT_1711305 [Coprinellus micaceus]|uniref:Uncharacterized protein n=1 Tax=Coprinellus micaceus TaxID=71717 RepID=A0A4Y7T5R7_COPMI|nr:hypothetical protein FA13DRAFT_1711305 [Coprinellus micaceus]
MSVCVDFLALGQSAWGRSLKGTYSASKSALRLHRKEGAKNREGLERAKVNLVHVYREPAVQLTAPGHIQRAANFRALERKVWEGTEKRRWRLTTQICFSDAG